jgi:hypothetical protein
MDVAMRIPSRSFTDLYSNALGTATDTLHFENLILNNLNISAFFNQ